jgi:NAD(P)-dependent dehydrogenase (short-subunit alcohol dehydrogenase family)
VIMTIWDKEHIENLDSKKVIITGASSGIGFETAKVLASKDAEVILAVRNAEKGERAANAIKASYPDARVAVMTLDLADLSSVEKFVGQFVDKNNRLDILINNAGVMIPPYKKTRDDFELQFGTNHLGHFAFTGRLLPLILATPHSRIVTVSSIATRKGIIDFDNLNGSRGYDPMTFYRQSKLANLMFAIELQHRLERAGWDTISIACHPGVSATNLVSRGSGKDAGRLIKFLMKIFVQSAEKGALPALFAATNPDLRGGEYIGPDGKGNRRGNPFMTDEVQRLFDQETATRLWLVSEKLTGVKFPV